MKKITLLLLLVLLSMPVVAQRVEPTFSWSNKLDYQINGEEAVTFKPGDMVDIEVTYTLGSTSAVPDGFDFVLVGLQDELVANKDVFANDWANETVAGASYSYPGAGAGGVTTSMSYLIPADAPLSSSTTDLTYRMLTYLAYTPDGGATIYGGAGASDPTLVYIRSQAEIDVLLSTSKFEKLTSFYPNPATNEIRFGNDVVTESYKIMSITGQFIKEQKATNRVLDVSFLKPGMYFLMTDTAVGKFIKN